MNKKYRYDTKKYPFREMVCDLFAVKNLDKYINQNHIGLGMIIKKCILIQKTLQTFTPIL